MISTLVAGMLPAKESNSLSDAMSSGCSIAHRPPTPPQISQYSCAIHASSGERLEPWAGRPGEERNTKRGRGKCEREGGGERGPRRNGARELQRGGGSRGKGAGAQREGGPGGGVGTRRARGAGWGGG